MQTSKTYYSSLDGLRFFAFLLVFLHHSAFYLNLSYANNFFWKFFRINGWIGVDIFFILTGFLITILLLQERETNNYFSLKKFHIKRILRIWPLYYVALFVGFFAAPFFFADILQVHYFTFDYWSQVHRNLPWYLTFLGNWNIVLFGFGDLRAISQLWAVCMDQQFYIFWPFVLLITTNFRKSVFISFALIIFAIMTRIYLVDTNTQHPGIYTNTFARIDTFTWGSLLAFILFYKQKILEKFSFLYRDIFQFLALIFLILYLYSSTQQNIFAIRNGVFGYVVVDLLLTYIVLCCIQSKSILVKIFDLNIFRNLGKISYGLYVWHILALELMFYFITSVEFNLFIPILGLPLTILFGYISYQLLEKPFLKMKSKRS